MRLWGKIEKGGVENVMVNILTRGRVLRANLVTRNISRRNYSQFLEIYVVGRFCDSWRSSVCHEIRTKRARECILLSNKTPQVSSCFSQSDVCYAAGDSDMRAVHLHRLHSGLVAFWACAVQGFRMRQGYLGRCLRFHSNGPLGGQILRHRGPHEKAPRHGYKLRFPISPSSNF